MRSVIFVLFIFVGLNFNQSCEAESKTLDYKQPFNLKGWIEKNKNLLKPPIGNKQLYIGNDNYIVMVVGGPNSRKDYHYNETEELYYQLKGNITVKTIQGGKVVDILIKEGEMFLQPPGLCHSPQRPKDTVGLVVEVYRPGKKDGFAWFCEKCNHKLHETFVEITDIVESVRKIV